MVQHYHHLTEPGETTIVSEIVVVVVVEEDNIF